MTIGYQNRTEFLKHKYGDDIFRKWGKKGGNPIFKIDKEFVCYHVTELKRLPDILRYGLKPNSDPYWFSEKTHYIMLSKYPYWWLVGEDALLLEIKDPKITLQYFDDPEGLRWPYNIKPKYINMAVEFKINPLWMQVRKRLKK